MQVRRAICVGSPVAQSLFVAYIASVAGVNEVTVTNISLTQCTLMTCVDVSSVCISIRRMICVDVFSVGLR